MHYRFGGGYKRVRGGNDLIVPSDAQRFERQHERVRAIGNTDRMFDSAEFRERLFKLFDERSAHESGAVQKPLPNITKLILKRVMLRLQIHERHDHPVAIKWLFLNLLHRFPYPPPCLPATACCKVFLVSERCVYSAPPPAVEFRQRQGCL